MDHVREHTDDPREAPRPIRPFLPGRVISPGEESDLVTIVQIMLNAVTLVCDRWELLPLSGVYDEATQAAVRGFCRGRLIAVFGCGGDRDPIKRPIMGRIGVELSDLAIITSDNPRTEDPMKIIGDILEGVRGLDRPYIVEENRREAIARAMREARKDDIIVLCGKGHETYQILGTVKTHLDEREEVAKQLTIDN